MKLFNLLKFHNFLSICLLRFKQVPLAGVILVSWAIAFVEYCMAVPANRWGSAAYTTAELKTIQEVVTLLVFAGFSVFISQGADHLELRHRLCLGGGGRVFYLSRTVVRA